MKRALVLAFLALAACGADGEPEPPAGAPPAGLTVTGSVEVGITGGG
jgi:hypothetical protein